MVKRPPTMTALAVRGQRESGHLTVVGGWRPRTATLRWWARTPPAGCGWAVPAPVKVAADVDGRRARDDRRCRAGHPGLEAGVDRAGGRLSNATTWSWALPSTVGEVADDVDGLAVGGRGDGETLGVEAVLERRHQVPGADVVSEQISSRGLVAALVGLPARPRLAERAGGVDDVADGDLRPDRLPFCWTVGSGSADTVAVCRWPLPCRRVSWRWAPLAATAELTDKPNGVQGDRRSASWTLTPR